MNTLEKYYSNLDELPLYNWEKLLGGEYGYVRKKRIDKEPIEDVLHFYKLYDMYVELYGLGDEYEKYMEERKHLLSLRLDWIITGNDMLLTYISISEAKLLELAPNNEGGITIGKHLIILSKWLGQWINKKKITVTEYKDLISEYERANKKK